MTAKVFPKTAGREDDSNLGVPNDRQEVVRAVVLAEAAEAEAEAAEAVAIAARARARALQLRRTAARNPVEEVVAGSEVADTSTADEEPQSGRGTGEAVDDITAKGPRARFATTRRWRLLRRPTRRVATLTVGIAIISGAVGASGFLAWRHVDLINERHSAVEFSDAARQSVVTLMSMDFAHVKEDVQRVIDASTGSFKDDFVKQSADFISTAEQSKITTVCTVNDTAVKSMTADSAVVLVAATSEVTNAAGAKQDARPWRLVVTIARDAGKLKLSKVEFVP